jgi:hypothetical protein
VVKNLPNPELKKVQAALSPLEKMSKSLLLLAAVAIAYASAAAKCTKDASKIPEVAIRQELCPASAPFFGFMGCAAALVFACKPRTDPRTASQTDANPGDDGGR